MTRHSSRKLISSFKYANNLITIYKSDKTKNLISQKYMEC